MSSSARDAFIAGSRGAPNYRGSTTNEAFKRGRQSADEFRRNRRFKKPKRRVSSNRWDRRLANNISDIFSGATEDAIKMGKDAKTGIMGAYGAMAKAGKELFMDPMLKASENKKILGDALTDNLRESVMTPSDDAFYKKYMRLADLATDNQERERLIGEANTALRNAQISSRINYGLGQLGEDTLGKEGFDSYKQPMFGEATPRFNMADFTAGLGSTPTGKAFLAEAEKAQAEETGESGSPIATAMKEFSFGSPRATFTSPAEMNREIEDYNNAVSSNNLLPTYDYNVYGDPMNNILSGEPGSGTGSLLLQSMYPGYRDFADSDTSKKYGLEDMNEFELMQFGYKNPTLATMFGFTPNYEFE